MTEPSLLLLIPAYNEEARIEPVLHEFGAYFRDHYRGSFQLVVVLNGCRDNTRSVVERVMKDLPSLSFLDFPAPIGKGGALFESLKLATQALKETSNYLVHAAKLLGITRATLRKRIEKFGHPPRDEDRVRSDGSSRSSESL